MSAREVHGIILGTEIIGIHKVVGEGVWLRLQQVSSLSAERSVLPLCYNASSIIKGLIRTHVK